MSAVEHEHPDPVTRDYLDLRLRAELAEVRTELAQGFAALDRRITTLVVGTALPTMLAVIATFAAVLIK